MRYIEPQEGKQTDFLTSNADIVIYGGAAGGGKTYALLLEAARHIATPGFGAVIFRRTLKQVTKEGGLWDTARMIYPQIGGRGVEGNVLAYYFDRFKTKIDFAYLARDDNAYDWDGTQIPLICFDELIYFTKFQFFYLISRNRSVCGVRPYIRAATNPSPDSWVREFIDWWIDDKGYAIEERSGIVRWLIHQNDQYHWFDRKIDAVKAFGKDAEPKSVTFIPSKIYDNKILLKADPGCVANLKIQGAVEKARLLDGNWDVRACAGDFFRREMFEVVDVVPKLKREVRCWDFAATKPSETNPDPDWTVGLRGGTDKDETIYITGMARDRQNPAEVDKLLKNTTSHDGKKVMVRVPQDPGSAGKKVARDYIKMLAGYVVKALPVSGSKELRAKPASGLAGIGMIKVLRGDWNKAFFKELEAFPPDKDIGHDDIVDTLSDVVEELTDWKTPVKVKRKPRQLG
jgi:predicted phage terminase large subunit-like protein